MITPVYNNHHLILTERRNAVSNVWVCEKCRYEFFFDRHYKRWTTRHFHQVNLERLTCEECQVNRVMES